MPVTIYTRTTCAPCRMVKTFLQRKGVKYEEKNLDDNPELAAEAFEKSGFTMVPIIVVGEKVISGMNLPLLNQSLSGIMS